MVCLHDPTAVVNDMFALQPLDLECGSRRQRHSSACSDSCDVFEHLTQVRITTSGIGVVSNLLPFRQLFFVEEPMISVEHPLVVVE